MAEANTGKRSYLAMALSLIVPGLGQIYLRKPVKGFVLFLGVVSAGAIIYFNSLPVTSWQDLTRFEGAEELEAPSNADQNTTVNSEIQESASQKRPAYTLHTQEDKFLFRIGSEFQSDLHDNAIVSEHLRQAFRDNRILLSARATISTKKEGSRWLINDNNYTYSVKRVDNDLRVYNVKKLMFRPSWKFKISGLIQGIIFWGYAIFDGWLGRWGFDKRAFRKKLEEAQQRHEAEENGVVNNRSPEG